MSDYPDDADTYVRLEQIDSEADTDLPLVLDEALYGKFLVQVSQAYGGSPSPEVLITALQQFQVMTVNWQAINDWLAGLLVPVRDETVGWTFGAPIDDEETHDA